MLTRLTDKKYLLTVLQSMLLIRVQGVDNMKLEKPTGNQEVIPNKSGNVLAKGRASSEVYWTPTHMKLTM